MRKRVLIALAGPILAVMLAGCGPRHAAESAGAGAASRSAAKPIGDVLRLTVVPYEAAEKLPEHYQPMADYLAKRLGKKKGQFILVVDYAGVIAALQAGQVDVAYLSSFPYALATSRMKLHPLAMPWVKGSRDYHGILFVRADSPINTLQDLKGKTFAFGDPTSTSGYLLPRALLEKEGVFSALKSWRNAGDATMVVKAVEAGTEDAGAAYQNVFEVVYRDTPQKAKLMRIIARTEDIPNGIYVARGDMPEEEVARLRQAFLDMNTDPEGRAAMLKAPNDKMVPADDRLFDHVRETARILNLDLTAFDKKKR